MAVDVAVDLMLKKGITPKFTISEFRDNIPPNCGVRSQSRVFNKLDKDLTLAGSVSIKVPVVHLSAFPPEIANRLAKCKFGRNKTSFLHC